MTPRARAGYHRRRRAAPSAGAGAHGFSLRPKGTNELVHAPPRPIEARRHSTQRPGLKPSLFFHSRKTKNVLAKRKAPVPRHPRAPAARSLVVKIDHLLAQRSVVVVVFPDSRDHAVQLDVLLARSLPRVVDVHDLLLHPSLPSSRGNTVWRGPARPPGCCPRPRTRNRSSWESDMDGSSTSCTVSARPPVCERWEEPRGTQIICNPAAQTWTAPTQSAAMSKCDSASE